MIATVATEMNFILQIDIGLFSRIIEKKLLLSNNLYGKCTYVFW